MNKAFLEWAQSFIEAFIIIVLLFLFFWPLHIEGHSMEGTFSSNDRVVINRSMVLLGQINRSDIVVCNIVENGKKISILKRVIGLPGDTISMEHGKVYVNGKLLQENYVSYYNDSHLEETQLKENEYFVLGDNRPISIDSRTVGPILKQDFVGKVILRWFPFDEIRLF